MSRKLVKRVILCGLLIGLAVGPFYLIRFGAIAVMCPGDEVVAKTNFLGAPEHHSKTVISLKRAGNWFSTTLIELRSWEVLVGPHWEDNDTPEMQLDFGCEAQTSRPVTAVGPI